MHVEQDDVYLVEDGLDSRERIRNNKTQEFWISGDFNPLEPHAGRLVGVPGVKKRDGVVRVDR